MDIATSAEVSYSSIPQNVVTDMKAVPGEAAVLQAGEDLQLRLWDTRTMQLAQVLPQHANIPLSCDVSSDGELLKRLHQALPIEYVTLLPYIIEITAHMPHIACPTSCSCIVMELLYLMHESKVTTSWLRSG